MNGVAMVVGENLDLDVTRGSDEFLDEYPVVPEGRLALAHGAFKRGIEIGMFVDPSHAAAAAARRRLDQNRITDLVGFFLEEFRILAVAMIAGHDRDAGPLHELFSLILEPHCANCAGGWTDKDHTGLRTGF